MAEDGGASRTEFFDGEIISEILARLPVKTLMRFRCVSKFWSWLISDPYLTKKHLSYMEKGITENTSRLLYSLDPPQSLEHKALKKNHSDGHFANRELDVQVLLPRYCPKSIVGCCDGLICVVVEEQDGGYFMLWNPCTNYSRKLPGINFPIGNPKYMRTGEFCGFGYDYATEDYKVMLGYMVFDVTIVHVFALKTSSWKVLRFPISINPFEMNGRGFFLNGALHWLATDRGYRGFSRTILPFDLAEEKFQDIILLPDVGITFNAMRVVGNRLCVFQHISSWRDVSTMWLMREYGDKHSWTQVLRCYRVDFPEQKRDEILLGPICILESGDILVYNFHTRFLVLYNLEGNTLKNVTKSTYCQLKCGALIYRETLISPVNGSVVGI